jgi:hypothetical protein
VKESISSSSVASAGTSNRRNLPGSSSAASRARKEPPSASKPFGKQPSKRQKKDTSASQTPGHSVELPRSPPGRLEKGTFIVIEPTQQELEEHKFRFWVGKLVEDGPYRGKFKVKWMTSFASNDKPLEFGVYKYWQPVDTADIKAEDVVYSFPSLSKRSKLMKKDETAICKLLNIKLDQTCASDGE